MVSDLRVPIRTPTSWIFLDDSGRVSSDAVSCVAGLKVRGFGRFSRDVKALRDRYGYSDEFRFTKVSRAKVPMYEELIELVARHDINIVGTVVDTDTCDPTTQPCPPWETYARIATRLVIGCANRGELLTVVLDEVSTPVGKSVEDFVESEVNRRFGRRVVVNAACMNSKVSDSLQIADVFAGAIAWDRRRATGRSGSSNSHKAKVVKKVKDVLNVNSLDARTRRLNVQVLERPVPSGSRPAKPHQEDRVKVVDLDTRRVSG